MPDYLGSDSMRSKSESSTQSATLAASQSSSLAATDWHCDLLPKDKPPSAWAKPQEWDQLWRMDSAELERLEKRNERRAASQQEFARGLAAAKAEDGAAAAAAGADSLMPRTESRAVREKAKRESQTEALCRFACSRCALVKFRRCGEECELRQRSPEQLTVLFNQLGAWAAADKQVLLYRAVRSFKANANDDTDDSKLDGEVWNKHEAWAMEIVYPLRRKFAIALCKSGKCRRSVEHLETTSRKNRAAPRRSAATTRSTTWATGLSSRRTLRATCCAFCR